MIGHHELNIWVGREDASKEWHASGGTLIGGVVDFLVDHGQPGFLQGILNALGPFTAAGLRQQAPQEGFIASLDTRAFDSFLTKSISCAVSNRSNIAETIGGIFALR